MYFTESRGNDEMREARVPFSSAILSPVASFGGIYSPESLPSLPQRFFERHLDSSYQVLALDLLTTLDIDVDAEILREALASYDRFDDATNPVPVVKLGQGRYVGELYHGPTRAFKDMALQPFGLVLSTLASQRQRQYLILTATSGDTGPAALETFAGKDNVRIACMYPNGGTSDVQRLQMVTVDAANQKTIGIRGNFDDAQTALKALLSSATFNQRLDELGISLSAANSVNFGRIIFQMLYHFHAYLELVRQGEIALGDDIVVHIPSGNFGNALSAYYALRLGLPISRIVIASNANNVLTEWIQTGRYDMSKRELIATTSPAMDILKSSNVERILFDLFGAERTRQLMQQLDEQGWYQLEPDEHTQIEAVFAADFCSDEEGKTYIKQAFERGYLMDPHTATCFKSSQAKAFRDSVNLIYSTAEWTKFAVVIDNAINGNQADNDRQALDAIATASGQSIPQSIESLFGKPIAHPVVVAKQDIEGEILDFLLPN